MILNMTTLSKKIISKITTGMIRLLLLLAWAVLLAFCTLEYGCTYVFVIQSPECEVAAPKTTSPTTTADVPISAIPK